MRWKLVSGGFLSLFLILTKLGCAGYPRAGGEAARVVDKVQAIKKGVATFRSWSFNLEVPMEPKKDNSIPFDTGKNYFSSMAILFLACWI